MNRNGLHTKSKNSKKRWAELGPLHPGVSASSTTCVARRAANAKIPKKPRRHGPYYQLSFHLAGARAARDSCGRGGPPEMRQKVANCKRLRELVNEWSGKWRSNCEVASGGGESRAWTSDMSLLLIQRRYI